MHRSTMRPFALNPWLRFIESTDAETGGDTDADTTDGESQDDESTDEGSDEETDDGSDDEPEEGADQLGDAGKKALDRMKAKWQAERKARRDAEAKLTAAAKGDEESTHERELIAKANQRILRSEVKAQAAGKLADPKDALRFLDLDAFEVNEDGDVDEDEIADAITDLIEKKPYLAAQGERRFKGSAGGGVRKESRPKQVTRTELERMTAAQVEKAMNEGRLADLLKSKN